VDWDWEAVDLEEDHQADFQSDFNWVADQPDKLLAEAEAAVWDWDWAEDHLVDRLAAPAAVF